LAAETNLVTESGLVGQETLAGSDEGPLQSIDLARRRLIINGYEYRVGTDMSAVKVRMLGSAGGALELLTEGMYVHIEYRQVRGGRIGVAIQQIAVDRRMDH
jgi:hypothetical protein